MSEHQDMSARRAKAVTLSAATIGVCVLLACAFAFRDRIAEQWWLYKLESGELEEQKVAAERLAEMGAVRAVPVMLGILRDGNLDYVTFIGAGEGTPGCV